MMAIKIENLSSSKLPRGTHARVESVLESLPREHLRGIEKLRIVDTIFEPRLKNIKQKTDLPGLYHPRQGTQPAWLEIATGSLLPTTDRFFKRLMPRLSFKGNLAAIIISLVGQHYHMTLRHSVKRGQIESAVRTYTEKHLRAWHEQQHTIRSRLFKPLQPMLEKWGKALQKRAAAERKLNK